MTQEIKKNHVPKAQLVDEIVELISQSKSIVIADYRGLTVAEATELRNQFRKAGVTYRVLKNTMVSRAMAKLNIEGFEEDLKGPSAFAFGLEDAVAPAKVIAEFNKKAVKLKVKAGYMEGAKLTPANVQALADLPPREVLIAKMLGSMNAPITGLVTVMSGTIRSLLYALNAVKDQKSE